MAKRSLEPGVSNALVIIIATATEGTSTKQYTRMSVEVVSLGVLSVVVLQLWLW